MCVALLVLIAITLQVSPRVWGVVLVLAVVAVLFLLHCAWQTMQKKTKTRVRLTLLLLLPLLKQLPLLVLILLLLQFASASRLFVLVVAAQYNELGTG
jgi:hypothetical protein